MADLSVLNREHCEQFNTKPLANDSEAFHEPGSGAS